MGLNIGQIIQPVQRTAELVGQSIQWAGKLVGAGIRRVTSMNKAVENCENQKITIRVLTATQAILGSARYLATQDQSALNAGVAGAFLYTVVTYPHPDALRHIPQCFWGWNI